MLENISTRNINYLDLSITIYREKFIVLKYDTRDDFWVKVMSIPFLDGYNLSYGVFTSQLVRYAKLTVISTY